MRAGEAPSPRPFGWGLVGPGRIAHRFAEAVQGLDTARLVAVQGRERSRSSAFAQRWARAGRPVEVADDIDALLADDRIDAIYIATPHAFHAAAMRRCIAAGRPVLCEKPLVPDLAAGLEVVALARKHRVFLMEAVWTRFLPVYDVVGEWLREGAIGKLRAIQSSFCFNLPFDAADRAYDPAQAGGSLLDIGVYNLTMTRWALQAAGGACPPLLGLHARGVVGPSGVDHWIGATLEFADGVMSQFLCGFEMSADNSLRLIGELGSIVVPAQFWQGTAAELRVAGREVVEVHRPFRINGFECEIEAAMEAIGRGAIECPRMPLEESLETLRWMCRIREQVGVRYPFEEAP